MASFCFQCNVDLFFGPYTDFPVYGVPAPPGMGFAGLCEGCGPTILDHRGWCVDKGCPVHAPRGIAPCPDEVYRRAERWVARRSGPLGPLLRVRDRILGTPWEPGEIHFNTRWGWWYNLYRAIREGVPLHVFYDTDPEDWLIDENHSLFTSVDGVNWSSHNPIIETHL